MKNIRSFFTGIFVIIILMVCVMPSWADNQNGCGTEGNDYIYPSLALCSTHVYNIGATTNPSYDNRSTMNDVIALKTTVIAQQMNKQYEYLEAMVRRLKTQLEKATLSASLQAAGATSDGSGGGSSGSSWRDADKSLYMSAGVDNCQNLWEDDRILECYQKNLNSIISQSGNGNKPTADMKRQLAHDFNQLSKQKFDGEKSACDDATAKCIKPETAANMSTKDFRNCLEEARSCMQNQTRAYKTKQAELQLKK
jgi:hypothetical protein